MTRREWLLLAVLTVAVVVATELPLRLPRTSPPEGLVAVYPSVIAAIDYPQYIAAIRDAAESGSWLSIDHFSTEPHEPILLRPFYTCLGFVSRATGVGDELIYRSAGYLGRILLCVAVYLFCALAHRTLGVRLLAFFITLTISGLIGVLDILSGVLPESLVQTLEQRSERPEYSTFLVLFHHPHLQVALALMLLLARALVCSIVRPRNWLRSSLWSVGIGTLVFTVILANPFSAWTVCAFIAGLVVLVVADEWPRPLQAARRLLPAAVGGAGGALVGAIVMWPSVRAFHNNAFWASTYGTPRGQETPSPIALLFQLFFVLVFALIGARRYFRFGTLPGVDRITRLLLLSWIGSTAILMLLPLDFQIRFALGLHPVLSVVAATGVVVLWRLCRRDGIRLLIFIPLTAAAIAAPLTYSRVLVLSARGEMLAPLLFRYTEEAAAARWLQENTRREDAVLSSAESGNYLAGQIPGRVFVGHSSGTLDYEGKLERARHFFSTEATELDRHTLLRDNDIDYVYFGPFEGSGVTPSVGLELEQLLEPVFRQGGATVYRVPS